MIRRAVEDDLPAISDIYSRIHDAEATGRLTTGWLREIYPTEATARNALSAGDLFVLEDDGRIVASARINRQQVDVYARVPWLYPADDGKMMVLHTLTVDPEAAGRGYGRQFLAFYETYAAESGCTVLRIDTNAKNTAARAMYKKHGYRESGAVPTIFNGIPGVMLICMEKELFPQH